MFDCLIDLPVDLYAPESFYALFMSKELNVIVMGSVRGNLDACHKT